MHFSESLRVGKSHFQNEGGEFRSASESRIVEEGVREASNLIPSGPIPDSFDSRFLQAGILKVGDASV